MRLKELGGEFKIIDIQHDSEAAYSPQVKEAYTLYNSGVFKIREDNIGGARADFKKATLLKKDFDDAYMLLGLCIFATGNRIDAMKVLNQINDVEKHNDAMYYFDLLSSSSKDVVTGYKRDQSYKETVRTIIKEREAGVEAKASADLGIAKKDAVLSGAEDESPLEEIPSHMEEISLFTDESDGEVPTYESFSTESISNYFMEFGVYEEPAVSAPIEISPVVKEKKKEKPVKEKIKPEKKPKAAKTTKTKRAVSKQMGRVYVIAGCFGVLLILATVVAVVNRNSLFKNEIPTGNTDSSQNNGDSNGNEGLLNQSTPPATEAPTEAPTAVPVELFQKEAVSKLAEAKELKDEALYYECYSLIASTDWTYLPSENTQELLSLKALALEKYSSNYFNQMYTSVGKGNWDDVLKYGLALLEYCPDYDRGAPAYFSIGKAYDNKGDKENAAKYYKLTMEKYPESKDAGYAEYLLKQLEQA